MEHDIEEELGFLHSEEGLEKDEMAGTADGQKFGETLNNAKEDSLWNIDFMLLENVKSQSSNVNSNPKLKGQIPSTPLY